MSKASLTFRRIPAVFTALALLLTLFGSIPVTVGAADGDGLADLIVTEVYCEPANPAPGDEVTFIATVKNDGSAPTPADTKHGVRFSVDLLDNYFTWSDDFRGPLLPGESVTLRANGGREEYGGKSTWTATDGPHTLFAWVNDTADVAESNSDNNQLSASFTVSTASTAPETTAATAPEPTSPPTAAARLVGDVNFDGSVDTFDALLIARFDAGQVTADASLLPVADVNGDGSADTFDALLIARHDAGQTGGFGTLPEPTTTAEPTTAEPTTIEPTTVEPTTIEPTTAEPTTTAVPIPTDPVITPSDDPEIIWRIIRQSEEYADDETGIAGLSIADYGVTGDGVTDVTEQFRRALDKLGAPNANGVVTGGTLYVPAGKYVIRGTLTVPKGVTIYGDWHSPDDGGAGSGTILMAYSGRGDHDATPFITIQPNSMVRNVSIWYPEQNADDITPYPPTVRMWDPVVWGDEFPTLRNITLINSYDGIIGKGSCTNIRGIYGTPLWRGVDMDGMADVSRWEDISFSPAYWAESGLPGAPQRGGSYEDYIKTNGTAFSMGRIDWSYLYGLRVDGYKIGLYMHPSAKSENSFPNGQCYDMSFTNCGTAVFVEGGAMEALANCDITNCGIGVDLTYDARQSEQAFQLYDFDISADSYAIRNTGLSYVQLLCSNIRSGQVYLSGGGISAINNDFDTAKPQIVMDKGSLVCIATGNTFKQGADIQDNGAYRIEVDDEKVPVDFNEPMPKIDYGVHKVTREALYNVYDFGAMGDGVSDDTEAIARALAQAAADGGGIVFLPPATYNISGTFTIPSNVELTGAVDIGRMPIQLGSILHITHGANDPDAGPVITMMANSGLRGVTLDQPQDYDVPIAYPYAVRGDGENIYILNLGLRNIYNGVDLFTNRCDNHVVDYLGGSCLGNVIRVGGGSRGGLVSNAQFNLHTIINGEETKVGSWPNSVPLDERDYYSAHISEYLQNSSEVMIFGDCSDERIFNNFNIFGKYGVHFISENGKGASGWCVGHAVDGSRVDFKIDGLGDMDLINLQCVSYRQFGFDDESYIYLTDSFDGTVNFINTIGWAVPYNSVIANNGVVNMYNNNFRTQGYAGTLYTGENARLNMYGNLLFNSGVISAGNTQGVTLNTSFLKGDVTADVQRQYAVWKHNIKTVSRWNVPDNFVLPEGETYLIADGFDNYPHAPNNGVENAVTSTDLFSEVQGPSERAYVEAVTENGNGLLHMHCGNNANQAYAYNHSTNFASGGKYVLYVRMRVDATRDEGCFWALINRMTQSGQRTDSVGLFNLRPNGSIDTGGTLLGSWTAGEYFTIRCEFDLSDRSHKTMNVTLFDANGNFVSETGAKALPESYQNNDDGIGNFLLNTNGSTDTGAEGTYTDTYIDYVVVTSKS